MNELSDFKFDDSTIEQQGGCVGGPGHRGAAFSKLPSHERSGAQCFGFTLTSIYIVGPNHFAIFCAETPFDQSCRIAGTEMWRTRRQCWARRFQGEDTHDLATI